RMRAFREWTWRLDSKQDSVFRGVLGKFLRGMSHFALANDHWSLGAFPLVHPPPTAMRNAKCAMHNGKSKRESALNALRPCQSARVPQGPRTDALRKLQSSCHQIPHLRGGVSHFASSQALDFFANNFNDGAFDCLGSLSFPEEIQQH